MTTVGLLQTTYAGGGIKLTGLAQHLKNWEQVARQLKTETVAIYLAYRDPRVPWYARVFAACVVGYAFSPIDLIPDFIPVLGYLDDLILVPLGIILAVKMIPPPVLAECREKAQEAVGQNRPVNKRAAVIIVAIWLLVISAVVIGILRMIKR